jgi:hypothetical protein
MTAHRWGDLEDQVDRPDRPDTGSRTEAIAAGIDWDGLGVSTPSTIVTTLLRRLVDTGLAKQSD